MTRLAILVLGLWCAACGGGAEQRREPARGGTSVAVTFDADGDGGAPARTVRLRCPSPRRAAACRALTSLPRGALAPPEAGVACTELYGGPETGRIAGTVDGRRVDASYARTNGCEIARFDRVAAVLGVARR